MTIFALKSTFKKVWLWCKRNWKFLVGVAIPLLVCVLARRKFNYAEISHRINEDYEKEIRVINESHTMEKNKKALAKKRYDSTVTAIEKRFINREKSLSKSKKNEIKRVIEKNADDPGEITRRLAKITGFEIHFKD